MAEERQTYTTGFGAPVENDQNSRTTGTPGPVLMQDTHLLEKLGHFDRERIPERVVHPKGAGAHGYFEVTGHVTNLKDPDMFWDFLSLTPESIHQVTILFSDWGTPKNFRHMNGYSSHTFKWHNAKGEYYWVQYHFMTEQGIQNLTRDEAAKLKSDDPDHATRDLYQAIERGDYPSWRVVS